jgi:hypothetical protein
LDRTTTVRQRLKPGSAWNIYGTAKAVPFRRDLSFSSAGRPLYSNDFSASFLAVPFRKIFGWIDETSFIPLGLVTPVVNFSKFLSQTTMMPHDQERASDSNCLRSMGDFDSVPRGMDGPITTAWL